MSMSPRSWASRRWLALPLLTGLSLSWALGARASLCAPGMDTGMEMSMPTEPSGGGQDTRAAHDRGTHCMTAPSNNEDNQTTCPFAINGTGPCGTTVPAPAVLVRTVPQALPSQFSLVSYPTRHPDPFTQVHLPPPRA